MLSPQFVKLGRMGRCGHSEGGVSLKVDFEVSKKVYVTLSESIPIPSFALSLSLSMHPVCGSGCKLPATT